VPCASSTRRSSVGSTRRFAERRLLADIVEGTEAVVQVADLDYRWLAINQAAAERVRAHLRRASEVGASMLELLAAQPEHQAR
jgi:hypothetical protein